LALRIGAPLRARALARAERRLERMLVQIYRHHGPEGMLARTISTGGTVLWVAVLLGLTLLLYYL
jgi:multicomponent Na+:H+ antiporter subunit D